MRRPSSRLLSLLLLALLASGPGCAYLQSPEFEDGHQRLTDHYDVRGDVSATEIERHTRDADWLHERFVRFFAVAPEGRTTICVFAERDAYHLFLRDYRSVLSALEWEVLSRTRGCHSSFHDEILFYRGPMERRVLAHEIAHRFVNAADPDAAPWVHEGAAGLVESVDVSVYDEPGAARVGDVTADAIARRALDDGLLPPLSALLTSSFNGFYRIRNDKELATSFVSFLLASDPERFGNLGDVIAASDEIAADATHWEQAWHGWLETWPRAVHMRSAFRRAVRDPQVRRLLPELIVRFDADEREREEFLELAGDPDPWVRTLLRWFVGSRHETPRRQLARGRHVAAMELGRRGDRRVLMRLIGALERRLPAAVVARRARREDPLEIAVRINLLGGPDLVDMVAAARSGEGRTNVGAAYRTWWDENRLAFPPQI